MPQSLQTEPELLEAIQHLSRGKLSPARRKELDDITAQLEWMRCQRDPYYFLTSLARTKDEHAVAKGLKDSYLPMPRRFPHVEAITRWWQRGQAGGVERKGFVPKSRQMMVTWIALCLYLWKVLNVQATRVAIQTLKELYSHEHMLRMYGVWERLPEYVKKMHPCDFKFCKMTFPATDSTIHGLAQGADQARQFTFADFFMDEVRVHDQAHSAYTAILPTIDAHGSFLGVSSAGPGFMADMCMADDVPGTREVVLPSWHDMDGVVTWLNVRGVSILQVHYSSHPDRGQEWVKKEAPTFPEGEEGKYWRGEQEIDFGAKCGQLVYPEFSRDVHVISIKKDDVPMEWPLFRVIDPGWRNPCCVLFVCVDGDGCMYVIDEIYQSGLKVPEVASKIKALTGRRSAEFTLIGHDAFRETQSAGKTIADQYLDEGIACSPVDIRIDPGILEVAKALMVSEQGEPRFKVLDRCVKTIWEFGKYRFPEDDEDDEGKKAKKEKPLPVNDHAMDCVRYAVMGIPDDYLKDNLVTDPHLVRDMLISHTRSAKALIKQRSMARARPDDSDLWDE